jgi:hypothetical protein
MRCSIAGLFGVLILLGVMGQTEAEVLTFSPGTDVPGTIQDAYGHGTGFTDRLPGTGGTITAWDPNLDMAAHPGYLTITSAPGFLAEGIGLEGLEAYGLHMRNVGENDITVQAKFRGINLATQSDHLGLYVGTSSSQYVRAALHYETTQNAGHQYLLSSKGSVHPTGYDEWVNSTVPPEIYSNGDEIRLTLSRTSGNWWMSWADVTNGTTGTSPLFTIADVSGMQDLYVGITYASPRGSSQTSEVEYFSVSTVPEPSTFVMFAVGAIGLAAYAWRKRRAA